MRINSTLLILASLMAICTAKWVTQYQYKKNNCKGDAISFEAVVPDLCVKGDSIFPSEVENFWTCENGGAVLNQYDSTTECQGSPINTVNGEDDKCMVNINSEQGVEINCENDFDAKGAVASNHGRYVVIKEYTGSTCGDENIFRISGYKVDKETVSACGGTGSTFNQVVCEEDNSVKIYSSCDSTCEVGCHLTISVAPGQCAAWEDYSIQAYCQNDATHMAVSSFLLCIVSILLLF